MSYQLRDRNPNTVYRASSSSSEYDSDSTSIDVSNLGRGGNKRRGRRSCRRPSKRVNFGEGSTQNIQASSSGESARITMLSWLIDLDIIQVGASVRYMGENCKNIMLEGKITRTGIFCSCCERIVTVSEFEFHAGSGANRPYENIFLVATYYSLLCCQIEGLSRDNVKVYNCGFNVIETQENTEDISDDACGICADGGNLFCCDDCPSTFHSHCMGMQSTPHGKWCCPYCVCKICGLRGNEKDELLTCPQCSKKYHWDCSHAFDLNLPSPFCGHTCLEINEKLEKLLGEINELGEQFTWTLLRRMEPSPIPYLDDLYKRTQINSKLTLAWKLMDEAFQPFMDRHTKINILQNVVLNRGSNYNRINFHGFYTAVMEKEGEVMAAACIRIHGRKVAEIPYIATKNGHKNKGMCRSLLTAIESVLYNFKIENLLIPSAKTIADKLWIEKCGFSRVNNSLEKVLTNYNTLMFPSTIRLQKVLFILSAESEYTDDMDIVEGENNVVHLN